MDLSSSPVLLYKLLIQLLFQLEKKITFLVFYCISGLVCCYSVQCQLHLCCISCRCCGELISLSHSALTGQGLLCSAPLSWAPQGIMGFGFWVSLLLCFVQILANISPLVLLNRLPMPCASKKSSQNHHSVL